MTEIGQSELGSPLSVEAHTHTLPRGESPLLVASGLLAPGGLSYKEYVPSAGEAVETAASKIASIVNSEGVVTVSVLEGTPVVALPEETAESIQARWRALKLLSSQGVVIEKIQDNPEQSPEELREEIGTEFVRIFGKRAQTNYNTFGRNREHRERRQINWDEERIIYGLGIGGSDVPAWLKALYIQMSSDGTLIKVTPDMHAASLADSHRGRTAYVGIQGGRSSPPQNIKDPLLYDPDSRNPISAEDYFKHLSERGKVYSDLEDHRLGEFLQVMKCLDPVTR